jgi:hypothetical protein
MIRCGTHSQNDEAGLGLPFDPSRQTRLRLRLRLPQPDRHPRTGASMLGG